MKKLSLTLLAAIIASSVHAADLKIAIVDMKRAFSEYEKGKESASKVKANGEKFVAERKERYESFQKLSTEVGKLQKKAQDSILSQAERAKAAASFEGKVKELRELQEEIRDFEQRRTGQLREEEMQVRSQILEEMGGVVEKIGKAAGFNLVLDKASVSPGSVPVVLFSDGLTDLTDDLIKELNSGAATKKEEPKAEEVKKATK